MVTADDVQTALQQHLEATDVVVVDISGGCGTSFEVAVVSPQFDGKRLLERHRMVNAALKDLMQDIHALSIKRAWTPAQQQEQTS